MGAKKNGGYLIHHIRLLNGRLYQKLLSKEPDALFRSEQEKILSILWNDTDGYITCSELSCRTGLANNTLTSMLKKLEEQGLVCMQDCPKDKRRKYVNLTELGKSQKEIGERVSQELYEIFYTGFSEEEIQQFEKFQERILSNLKGKDG
ncbi:MarR family transcriptional regulator [uncultured Granulicatella sp.]|uniref:MarR family winged helix-turn-helix transcriptional regulator n=1 Tax=uncultured Granulicatella sp. TaxID=316089 RepID=UPI0028DB53BC|nr:MarR family transcriptional regulator [uncultured Granulicatella sp.]